MQASKFKYESKSNPVERTDSEESWLESNQRSVSVESDLHRTDLGFLNQDDHIKLPFFIFNPNSKATMLWQSVVMVLILYTAILTPVRIAFTGEDTMEISWNAVGDFVFLIDLCLQFMTAREESNGTLITDKKQIAIIYVQSWFFIDFVAAIPINIIILTCFMS